MREFLPWTSPLLPAVAARMIADCIAAAPDSHDTDLSEWLLVVRGRAAMRRLLAALAAEAQRQGRALIPPRIVTQGSLDDAIFGSDPSVAQPLIQRIAWTVALQDADAEKVRLIFRTLFQRSPTAAELKLAEQFLSSESPEPKTSETAAVAIGQADAPQGKLAKKSAPTGPMKPLNQWERYTQVVLLTNELIFLN